MASSQNDFCDEYGVEVLSSPVDIMENPLLFIIMDEKIGCGLHYETCRLLSQLDTDLVVVGIAGTSRMGKSYLMNLLARKKTGFELGSTVQRKTQGIWIWCRPHPNLPNTTLILMDTEGLHDATTDGDDTRDMHIIVLTLLLSSTFIYNTKSGIDNNLIGQLGFVTELTNFIKVQAEEENENDSGKIQARKENQNDSDFDKYFPVLVVTVRDFAARLEIDGQPVTAGQYFDRCLALHEVKGDSRQRNKIIGRNEPRIKIRKYFPQRKRHAYVLPTPPKSLSEKLLTKLQFLKSEDMNPDFLEEFPKYQKFILNVSPKKTFGNQDRINGRMFVDMAKTFFSALLLEKIPCIQSALKLTADNENRRILDECIEKYTMMTRRMDLPVTLEQLMGYHFEIVAEITREYKGKLIFVEWEDIQNEYKANFEVAYNKLIKLNEEKSREKCEKILQSLNEYINDQMDQKKYLCDGGYNAYMRDLNDLKKRYKNAECKGVKSDPVLHEFLQKKETEIHTIIAIDKEIATAKVKEDSEKRLREEIERREKMMREEIDDAKRREETLQKTLKDTTKAMEDEWERRFEQQREDHERELADRQRNYDEMTTELKNEIKELKEQLKPTVAELKTQTAKKTKCTIS